MLHVSVNLKYTLAATFCDVVVVVVMCKAPMNNTASRDDHEIAIHGFLLVLISAWGLFAITSKISKIKYRQNQAAMPSD